MLESRLMNTAYRFSFTPILCLTLAGMAGTQLQAQVVINELVADQRTPAGTGRDNDLQFVELYNAGSSAVDISNWTSDTVRLSDGTTAFSDPIPAGTVLQPGGFYVIGASGVPNVDMVLGDLNIWPIGNFMYELRDNSGNLVDGIAINTRLGSQTGNLSSEQVAEIGIGWWGQVVHGDVPHMQSLSRYIDGRDTNRNGRDFGMLPATPGAPNALPQVGAFQIPDVDGMSVGTIAPNFGASFTLPRVVDPTTTSAFNPKPIPASPQGGNAIVAWDPGGGGNLVVSDSLVNSFDLYAYFDTNPLGGNMIRESMTYGIGTSDPFFSTPDPSGTVLTAANTANGNTGIGWLYQTDEATGLASLFLVDFGEGGNSKPTAGYWDVIQTIDMSSMASDWYRLALDYDPATGEVLARFGNQTFNFTTETDQVGTFYVGFREQSTGPVQTAEASPPIFDLFVDTAPTENADFNNDGIVDGSDFLAWQRGFGILGGATSADGDANADGNVDSQDLAIWQTQFGTSPLTAAAVAIPEPSTAILLLLGCAAGFCRRK